MTEHNATTTGESAEATQEFRVRNQYGIHARPAALLVKAASAFVSEIVIEKAGMRVSAKSIMGLLTIEGHQDALLRVTARGPDAEEALAAIAELFENRFYED